jgi:hypothetical protein
MRKKVFLLALAAFLIGVVCGAWGLGQFYGRFMNTLVASSLAADANLAVATLQCLHSGKETNAVELIEIKLDGDVVGLGALLGEVPNSRRDPTNIKVLKRARDYRAKFPRKTDSLTDEGIRRAFALLERQP